jgi:hypothetical protein
MTQFASLTMLALSSIACSHDCLALPCALPTALALKVTSLSSGSGVSALVAVSGAVTGTVSCDSSCMIMGYAGTYTLSVTAPGYQSAERTVLVRGSPPAACGCGSAQTENVTVVLTPTP